MLAILISSLKRSHARRVIFIVHPLVSSKPAPQYSTLTRSGFRMKRPVGTGEGGRDPERVNGRTSGAKTGARTCRRHDTKASEGVQH